MTRGTRAAVVVAALVALAGCSSNAGRSVRDVGGPARRIDAHGPVGLAVAVDPGSGRVVRRVAVPGQPEGIVAAAGSIWVVRQAARKLTRIGPDGAVGPNYPLGSEPRLVAAGGGALFVADVTDGTITRVDPRSASRTVGSKVCDGPQNLVDAAGTLWVACTRSDRLVAVDEATLRATAQLHVSGEPDGERVVNGHLYVAATVGPTVYEVRTGAHPAVGRQRVLGKALALQDRANVDVVLAAGRIWVSSFGENSVLDVPAD
jgi:sugar lactone lactonase YvrE